MIGLALLAAKLLLPAISVPAAIGAWAKGSLSKPVAIAIAIAGIVAVALIIRHGGEVAGAAKATGQIEAAHTVAVADARHDERQAFNASAAIATSTAQRTVAAAAVTHYIIEDLHHAIDAVPPAAPGAPLPAAPVDGLRASLNAGIAHADRAADAADALP